MQTCTARVREGRTESKVIVGCRQWCLVQCVVAVMQKRLRHIGGNQEGGRGIGVLHQGRFAATCVLTLAGNTCDGGDNNEWPLVAGSCASTVGRLAKWARAVQLFSFFFPTFSHSFHASFLPALPCPVSWTFNRVEFRPGACSCRTGAHGCRWWLPADAAAVDGCHCHSKL